MKHLIGRAVGSLVLLAAVFATGAIAQEQREAEQKAAEDAQESALQQEAPVEYACPQCPGIRATWAATCPKCRATLQRVEDESTSGTVRRAARLTDERFAAQLEAAIAEQIEAMRKAQGMPKATEETPAQGETTRRLSTFIDMITPLFSDKDLQEKMKPLMKWMGVAMNVPLSPYDPGMLLARKHELRLTAEQAGALEAIAEDARERAKGLLTDTQRAMLEEFDESPRTLNSMTAEMMRPVMDKVQVRLHPRFTTRDGRAIDLVDMSTEVVLAHGQPMVIGGLDESSDSAGSALFSLRRERDTQQVTLTLTPYIQGAP